MNISTVCVGGNGHTKMCHVSRMVVSFRTVITVSPESKVAKGLSEKQAGDQDELMFIEVEAQFCSQTFGHNDPEQSFELIGL